MFDAYPQKKIFICSWIIACYFTTLICLDIAKLTLDEMTLTNQLTQPINLTVTFARKCPDCPRLHNTYTKLYSIPAGASTIIADHPHIIRGCDMPTTGISHMQSTETTNAFIITQQPSHNVQLPDFTTTLKQDKAYTLLTNKHPKYLTSMPDGITPDAFFDKLTSVYEKNKNQTRLATPRHRIPRIIHTCWFGSHKMPDLYQKWLDGWKKNHPGWALMIWDEKMVEHKFQGTLHNQTIYNEAKGMYDYATMSKIARYEVLNKFGGLYIDPDIKNFESLAHLHEQYDFYAGLGSCKTYGACNNAVIGSKPGHPILKAAINAIKACETKPGGLYDWTAKNLGHRIFTQAVYDQIGLENNTDIIFPKTFFSAADLENDFCHPDPIYQADYVHIKHAPESLCCRGSYSTVS